MTNLVVQNKKYSNFSGYVGHVCLYVVGCLL